MQEIKSPYPQKQRPILYKLINREENYELCLACLFGLDNCKYR